MTALIQYGCHLHRPLAVLWICVKQESKPEMGACQSILGRSPNNIFVEWKRDRKCPDVWRDLRLFGEARFRRTAWGGPLSHWGQCWAGGKCGSWWVTLAWKEAPRFLKDRNKFIFGVTSKGCWNPHKTYLSKCFLEFLILNSQDQDRNNWKVKVN